MRVLLRAVAVVGLLAMVGCNCGGVATVGGDDAGHGGGTGGTGGADNGSGGAGNGNVGGGSGGAGGTCGNVSTTGTLGKKPVDIIFVIDNSGSMTEEIVAVQDNINASFAQIIESSGLDYRVIMLSRHGTAAGQGSQFQSVCISAPLAGNASCSPVPAQPTNTARFFQYSTEISSTNSYNKVTGTYNQPDEFNLAPQGWQAWLRADAFKVFVEITDDNASTSAQSFETALLNLTPKMFGTAAARNYVWHSITGIQAKAVAADAYLPTEPLDNSKCPTAVNPGINYQNLSIITGGLRFPICDPSLFSTVFRKVAEGVVAGAQVACQFDVPPPPAGYSTSNKVIVNYTPGGGGAVQAFTQVMNEASCGPDEFYLANNQVVFCPQTCTLVKADTLARVDVIFTCDPGFN